MGSSDSDNDLEQMRQLMFLAVSVKRRKGREISEEDRCSEVQGYLDDGVDINAADEEGNTVLHIVARKGFEKVVEFLLKKRACTKIENNQGDTALTLAEKLGKQEIARILKDSDGNPSVPVAGTSRNLRFDNPGYDSRSVPSTSSRKRTADTELVDFVKKLKLAPVNINPNEPSAGTSNTQRFDNPGNDSRSVPSSSRRKRATDIGLLESVKELKLAPANETHASCPDSGGTSSEEEHRRNEEDEDVSQNSRWDTNQTYAASGAKHSLHGVIYQLKHLMLILNLAWKMGYRFRLATEIDSAEKFDDLVFEYEDGEGSRVHRFVQLKHKQDDSKLIRVGDLLADDSGEFSVKKYFTSWRKVKKHSDFAESGAKYFILCTNIGLDVAELKNGKIDVISVEETDDFLKVKNRREQPPRYKLLPDSQSELYAKLESASEVHQLAKVLAKCVHDSIEMTLKTDILKRYHTALAQEVLIHIGKKTRKFSDAFVRNNGLSPIAENFRAIFFTYVKRLPSNKNASETDIWKNLEKKSIATSESFGKSATGSQQTQLDELPDDHITDKEILDFLDEFVLAVNQPNEVELGELIRREFGEYSQFNLLNTNFIGDSFQNIVLNWFKDKKGVYLVREDAKNFFDQMERELSSLITVGLNLHYPAKLKKYDVQFKREIEGLRNFLNSSKSKENLIWQLTSFEQTLLTALRIYQTIEQMVRYKKKDSFLFIELADLLLPGIMNTVFRAFNASGRHNLLIIDCGLDSTRLNTDKLWNNIHEMKTKLDDERITGKRIILIVPKNDVEVIKLEIAYKTSYERERDISIDKLEEATQRNLLRKNVIKFQGRKQKTSFVSLLGTDNFENVVDEELEDYRRILNQKTLVKLIRDEEIPIGGEAQGLGDIAKYYIDRRIDRVVVKEHALRDTEIQDMLAFSGNVEEVFGTPSASAEDGTEECSNQTESDDLAKYVILDTGEETDDFDNLSQHYPNRDIHWLQRESGKFVWMKSYGSISNLTKYRDETRYGDDNDGNSVIPLTEEQLAEYDERPKIVILSDTAGMGKSTVLTRLAEKIRENEPSLLVMNIDLTDHTTVLASEEKERSFDSNNIHGAVDFLVDKLNPILEGETVTVFKTIIKVQRKAALLFDGFDEISPDYKKSVTDLLQALAKLNLKKLFITTRPHTSRALEEKLGVFAHTLRPFSEANQIEFLTKFWKRESIAHDSISCLFENKEPLQDHAQNVINLLARSIDPSMKEFTGVPLQTRMVAEVFPFEESEVPKTISIIEMYSKFVDKKYHIFCTEKGRTNHTNLAVKTFSKPGIEVFSMIHQRLALDVLFDETTVTKLLSTQPTGNDFNDTWKDMIRDQQRTGIVTPERDGRIRFIHRTFAEYFAARFLVQLLQDDRTNQAVREVFIAQLFVKREYEVVRAFLNCLLAGKNEPPEEKTWKFDLNEYRNPDGDTAYHVVARERHVEIAKFLLNSLREHREFQFSNINCPSKKDSETPLIVAVKTVDNLDVVKRFIDAGADVNLADSSWEKKTPLHASIHKTVNVDVVKELIRNGANTNPQTRDGETPLHNAARFGHLHLVKYLVKKGANINAQSKYVRTPLHSAAESGDLAIVTYLVEKGADVNLQTENGYSPLSYAVRTHNQDLVKYLAEKGADIKSQNVRGETLLHLAVESGDLDIVKYLANQGSDINSQTIVGQTPLHFAVHSGKLNLMKYLAEKGADINFQAKNGETPLHYAARFTNVSVVKYLTELGADINSKTEEGKTILHWVAQSGNLDLMKYLAKKGADIYSQTKNGNTVLHFAALSKNLDAVKYLTENGADINCRSVIGQTVLHYAARANKEDLVKYLTENGAHINSQCDRGDTPLHYAARYGYENLVKYLVEKGADINSQTKKGETPLHSAVESGDLAIVKYLADKSADIDSQTEKGETPLHSAAESGHLGIVKYLAEKDADVNSQTTEGKTPLHLAAEYRELEVVEYLIEKGANINPRDQDGRTPLDLAKCTGNLKLMQFLVEEGATSE